MFDVAKIKQMMIAITVFFTIKEKLAMSVCEIKIY